MIKSFSYKSSVYLVKYAFKIPFYIKLKATEIGSDKENIKIEFLMYNW